MDDNIILNKIAIIERCIARIKEEYYPNNNDFDTNYTRQDSIILNLERACQSAIDLGTHIIRTQQFDIPQSSRDIFKILKKNNIIEKDLSDNLQAMTGFRNIAVHNYQDLNLEIVKSIIENNLSDFLTYCKVIAKKFIV